MKGTEIMAKLMDELAANVSSLIDALEQYTKGEDESTALILRDGRDILQRYLREYSS